MDDLISRQAALEAMDTWDKFGCDPDGKLVRYDDDKHYIPYVHYEDMVHAVKNLPPAQPEIIQCKDCKWCEDADGLMCKNTASWVVATDYDFGCVLAERRQDG